MNKKSTISNEIDPHFFLNAFTALAHLIGADSARAYLFNNKMAHIYKYFLLNKEKTLVSVEDELSFLESYFFLMETRYEDKLQLTITYSSPTEKTSLIVPFVLQFLVDYAIKKTTFSEANPLGIEIQVKSSHINVVYNKGFSITVNNVISELDDVSRHYQDRSRQRVVVENKGNTCIRLPLISSA